MHLSLAVGLSALLFGVGVYGVLARRNAVALLMAVELMLKEDFILSLVFQPVALTGQGGAAFEQRRDAPDVRR